MSDTLLEQTRALHEDLERLERVIVKDLKQEAKTHRDKLLQDHRVKRRLDTILDTSSKLIKIYEDEDKSRKEEINDLGGEDKMFVRFYDRLKEVKDYHRKFTVMEITEAEDDSHLLKEEPTIEFSGEEGYGRFLDLHGLFTSYVNLRIHDTQSKTGDSRPKAPDYLEYLSLFSKFSHIPVNKKLTKPYRIYTENLLSYLVSFLRRTQPLVPLDKQLDKVATEVEASWAEGKLGLGSGPSPSTSLSIAASLSSSTSDEEGVVASANPNLDLGIDLMSYESAEELAMENPDKLKAALTAAGLKCGGTLKERANRLWILRDTPLAQLDHKHFAKGTATTVSLAAAAAAALAKVSVEQKAEAAKNRDDSSSNNGINHSNSSSSSSSNYNNGDNNDPSMTKALKSLEACKQISVCEAQITRLANMLKLAIQDTRSRVERKQAQTYDEIQADVEELEAEAAGLGSVSSLSYVGKSGGGKDGAGGEEGEEGFDQRGGDADEEEEDDFVYNPLKLPIGWDGKPIPYWLYKLHGLNQEFKCEICGNYSYWGRRAFEKHFKEWRHQNGMRALGIPNSKMFYEVTGIEEAQHLWADIRERGKGGFRPEAEEELEDALGNVYNRKTFEDLRRQGLI
mmetsp:Transcript_16887/g.30636  ORF Transcript_16887/g.30636 Transcript_16887/m.30636 type:complete len:624 (-) Transcript_16887:290-2161(-)